MDSPSAQVPTPPTVPTEDDPGAEETGLQLPLSASLVLTALPKDASTALAEANENEGVPEKVTIRLLPIASAPPLRQKVFKVSASNRFETVVSFLSKKLTALSTATTAAAAAAAASASGQAKSAGGGQEGAEVASVAQTAPSTQVFCYVNSVFAPGLDEGVGALWKCFKTDDQLIVSYSTQPAFG